MGLFDIFKREEPTAKADRLVIEGEDDLEVDDTELEDEELSAKEAPEDRETAGPFDADDDFEDGQYLDFGAIRVPVTEGIGLRLEMQDKTQRLVAIALDVDGSSMQVQAFAAPRSSGLWADVRSQLTEQLGKQGGKAEAHEDELGTSLRTAVPVVAGGKPERRVDFIGVDGPRWFLRGVITGQATIDDERRERMYQLFRGIVVSRGSMPVPPRDLLPLKVPEAMAKQMEQARAAAKAREQAKLTPAQRTAQLAQQQVRERISRAQKGGEGSA